MRRLSRTSPPHTPPEITIKAIILGVILLVLLAIPIVIYKGENPLQILLVGGTPSWPGMILLGMVIVMMYSMATKCRAGQN